MIDPITKNANSTYIKDKPQSMEAERALPDDNESLTKPFLKKNIRNLLAYPLAKLLIKLGYVDRALQKAKEGKYILSIYFHNPSKAEFENTVLWLKNHGFDFLSPADLERIIELNQEIPQGAVIITVDDGWESNKNNIVDIANRHQIPVTIFCSTQAIEEGNYWWSYFKDSKKPTISDLKKLPNEQRMRFLSKVKESLHLKREALTLDQLKKSASSKYITIGAHTHSHPILTKCSDKDAYEEIKTSKDKLEEWLGKEINYFAYPNGNYGEREIKALEDLGFKLGFANEPRYLTPNNISERMEIPRFGFLEGASFEENMCRIAGIWHSTTKKFKRP